MALRGSTGKRSPRAPASRQSTPPQAEAPEAATAKAEQPEPASANDANNPKSADGPQTEASNPNALLPEHIAVAAYYRAEQRGFTGDRQVDDWLAAEKALAAETASKGDDDCKARGYPEEDIQPDQVEQWAEKFQVSPERLRVAIQRVGPVSSEVQKFLEDPGGR